MKKNLVLTLSTIMLIIASCKKNSSKNEEQNPTNCQLTESFFSSTGGDSETTLYAYDTEGRISTVKFSDGSYQETYAYTSTQITKTVKDGSINRTYTYSLNAQGRVTTENAMADNYKVDYTYNNDGYLTQSIETNLIDNSKVTTTYTYTDGNLTKVVSPTSTLDITYTSDAAKDNFFVEGDPSLPAFNSSILKSYFGKTSKNLVAKISYGSGYNENYSYEKDANGNITKVTMRTSDNSGYTLSNKFSCK